MKFVKKLAKMLNNWQLLLLLVGFCLGITTSAKAQQNSIERLIPAPYDEYVAGAAGNLLLRGPWISKGWRKPIPRLIIWSVASGFYEKFLDRSHSGNIDATARLDWIQRQGSYLVVEGIILLGKKIF